MANKKKPGCLSQLFSVALLGIAIAGFRSCLQEPVPRPPAAQPKAGAIAVAPIKADAVTAPAEPAAKGKQIKEPLPAVTDYVILRDTPINSGSIRDVYVRIPEPIAEDALRSLATQIKATSSGAYPKTSIFFLLPQQDIGRGAWARALFKPNLEIHILGATVEQKSRFDKIPLPDGDVIGDWYLDMPGTLSHRLTLFRREGNVYMRRVCGDGSSGEVEVMPLSRHCYFEDNSYGDYMRINEQGNLDFCSGSEKRRAYTAAKTEVSPPLLDDPTTEESVADALKARTLKRLEESLQKIVAEKKEVGKTRDRIRMKQLMETEQLEKKELLRAKNRKPEEWAQEVRRLRGE